MAIDLGRMDEDSYHERPVTRLREDKCSGIFALLITCETFAELCKSRITTIEVDNITAKAWFDASRCPSFPFDRCAQRTHLVIMECVMKIATIWVTTSANTLADIPSRKTFSRKYEGNVVAWLRLLKVRLK